ncbi:MAG TPA: protein translocase subunit SecD [Acidimicrobiales bacterium]|nr:protein translocase subunit SecD [Acidimicrobiales bacterium]
MRRKILLPLIFILVVAYGGLAATIAAGNSPELGLDLQGGVSVVLAPTTDASGEQLDQALEIIRSRVDALGVAEPEITRQGDAIVVQLPGVKNRDRALELVGQTAELRFRPVLQDLSGVGQGGDDEPTTSTTATTAPGSTDTTAPASTDTTAPAEEAALGLVEGESAAAPLQEPTTTTTAPVVPPTTAPAPVTEPSQIEETPREQDAADATVILPGLEDDSLYQLGPTLATGRIVKTAAADIQSGQWLVSLEMRGGENGIDKFNEIAAKCYVQAPDPQVCPSGRLAIVLDSVVQSSPSISEASYEADSISISGSFGESEAKDLALVLRYGSLPVELERQSVQTVSASLGDDSLRAGIIAGVVGLALVALYMLVYYRALGLVVIVGLTVWASLLYTIISYLGVAQGLALTLAGVTGIIVSIGVTVDSYVVYFERLKDEVKAGRTLRSSTERAFKRAFRTILAADTSAFIGAAVLWWLTVGSVRGFAFFLGLSTVLDVFVAWFFTRPTVTLLSRSRVFTDMPVLGVARGLAAPAPAPAAERPVATAGVGR